VYIFSTAVDFISNFCFLALTPDMVLVANTDKIRVIHNNQILIPVIL